MRKMFYSALLLGVLEGCMVESPRRTEQASPTVYAPGSPELLKVADDSSAGAQKRAQFNYRDPGTGTTYLINPGWKIVQRGKPPLAKANANANAYLQTWSDWSGQVETRIYECASPSAAQHQNSIGCQVEPDFITVGGGAYVDYGTGPGALLWESRVLDENLATWVASSKDQGSANPHMLYTYAIGLRLKDQNGNYIPKNTLLNHYIWAAGHQTYTPSHAPADSTGASRREDVVYFGAGARLNWSCCGAFLTKTLVKDQADYSIGVAAGKDHGASDPSTIVVSGACIPRSLQTIRLSWAIPGFGQLQFKEVNVNGGSVGTGVATALADVEAGYVVTGIGGESRWTSGPGRLLFGLKPTGNYTAQFGVYSKDHKATSAGYNVVSLVEVRKAP